MQTWLPGWYGIDYYAPTMKPSATQQLQQLESLPSSDFEIEFMEDMIRHQDRDESSGVT